MRNKLRIKGTHKQTGKKVYMSWAIYKGQTYYSFNAEPTKYKIIEDKDFVDLQLTAQASMNNVQWELENAKRMQRFNAAATTNNSEYYSNLTAAPSRKSTYRTKLY